MARKRHHSDEPEEESTGGPDFGEHAFEAEEARKLSAAMDECDDDAEAVSEKRAAVGDTLKAKGYMRDAFQSAHKLKRKKSTLEAQAYVRQFLLYCTALGIWDQEDMFAPAPKIPELPSNRLN